MSEAQAIAAALDSRLDCSSLVLTADVERAAAELRRLDKLCTEWEAKAATWLASPEAAKRLEGYRELAQQVNRLEAECEQLRLTKAAILDALWKASGDNMEAVSGYLESVGLSLDAMKETK